MMMDYVGIQGNSSMLIESYYKLCKVRSFGFIPNEFYQNEYLFEFLRKKMKKCRLEARSFRLHSSSIPETHPLVPKCPAMNMQPFGSPTLSDQALMSFPSMKLGPDDSARSHSADEFIRISEIEQAIDTYVRLLSDFQL